MTDEFGDQRPRRRLFGRRRADEDLPEPAEAVEEVEIPKIPLAAANQGLESTQERPATAVVESNVQPIPEPEPGPVPAPEPPIPVPEPPIPVPAPEPPIPVPA